jgi:hypothetical protein
MKVMELVVYHASDEAWESAVNASLKYALLSFAFTANRMALAHLPTRITNIAKGKLAEELLRIWARETGLPLDFNAGATAFHTADYFDFSYQGHAFDLKNNFLYHSGDSLPVEAYLTLPALVPHRYDGDQWSRRGEVASHPHLAKAYLFTYMKQADRHGGEGFLRLRLNSYAWRYLEAHLKEFATYTGESPPFDGDAWYASLAERGAMPQWELRSRPAFVVAGVATAAHYQMFQDADGIDAFGYHPYMGGWYGLREEVGLAWCGGLLYTRIRNAACPVGFLPAFATWQG